MGAEVAGLLVEFQDGQGYTKELGLKKSQKKKKEIKQDLDYSDLIYSLCILSFVDSRDLKMAAQSAPKVVLKSTTKMSLNER